MMNARYVLGLTSLEYTGITVSLFTKRERVSSSECLYYWDLHRQQERGIKHIQGEKLIDECPMINYLKSDIIGPGFTFGTNLTMLYV